MKRFLSCLLTVAMLLGGLAAVEGSALAEVTSQEELAEAEANELAGSLSLAEVSGVEFDEESGEEAPASEAGAGAEDAGSADEEAGEDETGPEPQALNITAGKTTLIVGETLPLTVTCDPEGATASWSLSSSDRDVATVDADGLVTATGVGTATITALADSGASAAVTLEVVPAVPAAITLNYSDTQLLAKGKKLQLEADIAPEGVVSKLTWSSSKVKYATVSKKGLVTAKKVGTTTIAVRTANGKTAKVKIKVYDPKAVSSITAYMEEEAVSGETLKMDMGSKVTFEVRAYNAAGEPLNNKVTWKSSKKRVATINSKGKLIVKGSGKTKITATMKGKTTSFSVKVAKMTTGTYGGEEFKIVNTPADPILFGALTEEKKVCTRPKYGGKCLSFCYYYVRCMLGNKTNLSPSKGSRGGGPKTVHFRTEKFGSKKALMGRLYDLLNTGVPQILMVEAVTHPGSRHFVVVVGYRADVTGRKDLKPKDLLIIDSQDGRLESMDRALDPKETRKLFTQEGKYRIEAATW